MPKRKAHDSAANRSVKVITRQGMKEVVMAHNTLEINKLKTNKNPYVFRSQNASRDNMSRTLGNNST